mgnify:CR=1 FL=1
MEHIINNKFLEFIEIIKNDFKIKEGGKYKVKFVILKIINFIIQNKNGQKFNRCNINLCSVYGSVNFANIFFK